MSRRFFRMLDSYHISRCRYKQNTLYQSGLNKFHSSNSPTQLGLDPKLITNQLITNNVGSRYAGGPPDEEVIEFPGPDISWEAEWKEFLSAIRENREPMGNGQDGLEAMRMIEAVYRSSKENRPIRIKEVK